MDDLELHHLVIRPGQGQYEDEYCIDQYFADGTTVKGTLPASLEQTMAIVSDILKREHNQG